MEYAEWNMFPHMYFHFKKSPSPDGRSPAPHLRATQVCHLPVHGINSVHKHFWRGMAHIIYIYIYIYTHTRM